MGMLFVIRSKQNSYSLPRDGKNDGLPLTSEPMERYLYWRGGHPTALVLNFLPVTSTV